MYRPLRTLFLAFFLISVGTSWAQEYYVLAQPSLNLRDANSRSKVIASIPFGAKVDLSLNKQETARIGGMDGSWVEVTYVDRSGKILTGVVFDAFLFPFDAPDFFGQRSEYLTFGDYAKSISPAWHHGQTYPAGYEVRESMDIHEGVEGLDVELIFSATPGQALRMYRMWLVHLFGEYFDEFHSYDQTEFQQIMDDRWDGVSELSFYPSHEWMRMSLGLKPYRDAQSSGNPPLFVITHHQHAH